MGGKSGQNTNRNPTSKNQVKKITKTGRQKNSIPLHIQKRKNQFPNDKAPAKNDQDICSDDWGMKPPRELPIHKRIDRFNIMGYGKPRKADNPKKHLFSEENEREARENGLILIFFL